MIVIKKRKLNSLIKESIREHANETNSTPVTEGVIGKVLTKVLEKVIFSQMSKALSKDKEFQSLMKDLDDLRVGKDVSSAVKDASKSAAEIASEKLDKEYEELMTRLKDMGI